MNPSVVIVDELQFLEHRRFLIAEISKTFAVPAEAFDRLGQACARAQTAFVHFGEPYRLMLYRRHAGKHARAFARICRQ